MKKTTKIFVIYSLVATALLFFLYKYYQNFWRTSNETISEYKIALEDCESYNPDLESASLLVGVVGHNYFEGMNESELLRVFSDDDRTIKLVKTDKNALPKMNTDTCDYAYRMNSSVFFVIKEKKVISVECEWINTPKYMLNWYMKNGELLGYE